MLLIALLLKFLAVSVGVVSVFAILQVRFGDLNELGIENRFTHYVQKVGKKTPRPERSDERPQSSAPVQKSNEIVELQQLRAKLLQDMKVFAALPSGERKLNLFASEELFSAPKAIWGPSAITNEDDYAPNFEVGRTFGKKKLADFKRVSPGETVATEKARRRRSRRISHYGAFPYEPISSLEDISTETLGRVQ